MWGFDSAAWSGWGVDLLDVVAPRDCVGCAAVGRLLCRGCADVLAYDAVRVDRTRVGIPVAVGAPLDGVVGSVIRAYKADGGRSLAVHMGGVLAKSVAEAMRIAGVQECSLVGVPASFRARWTRGEDILDRVIVAAAGNLRGRGSRVGVLRMLRPVRAVADQRHLDAQRRRVNVSGSLRAHGRRVEQPIIVVDDVLTTGSTMREACRALGEVAFPGQVVAGAVVAATFESAER